MVGSKNRNHHRNYSFRVVEINGGLREKANRRVENWRECQQATSDGQLIRPSRSLSLVETDDDARRIPDTSCYGTESSGPRVRCRQVRTPARTGERVLSFSRRSWVRSTRRDFGG
jgi:hypothetical protein